MIIFMKRAFHIDASKVTVIIFVTSSQRYESDNLRGRPVAAVVMVIFIRGRSGARGIAFSTLPIVAAKESALPASPDYGLGLISRLIAAPPLLLPVHSLGKGLIDSRRESNHFSRHASAASVFGLNAAVISGIEGITACFSRGMLR